MQYAAQSRKSKFGALQRLTSNKLQVSQYRIRTQDFIVVRPRFIGNDLHPLRAFIDFCNKYRTRDVYRVRESRDLFRG